jgi:hypothetical protein
MPSSISFKQIVTMFGWLRQFYWLGPRKKTKQILDARDDSGKYLVG